MNKIMYETTPNQPMNEAEYDRKLEQLVDSGRWSYDDARRMLGKPPYELWTGPDELKLRGAEMARAVLRGLLSGDDVGDLLQ